MTGPEVGLNRGFRRAIRFFFVRLYGKGAIKKSLVGRPLLSGLGHPDG